MAWCWGVPGSVPKAGGQMVSRSSHITDFFTPEMCGSLYVYEALYEKVHVCAVWAPIQLPHVVSRPYSPYSAYIM